MGEGSKGSAKHSNTPLWHRRSAAAVVLFALVYPIIYAGHLLTNTGSTIDSSALAAILSAGAFILGLICYFYSNFSKLTLQLAYLLLVSSIVVHISLNNSLGLIDVAMWSLAAVFAGAFGLGIMLIVLLISVGYLLYAMLTPAVNFDFISNSLVILFPVLVGAILWRQGSYLQSEKERHLNRLTSQLGAEASKSNIVINAINDGVIVVNSQGIISLINPAASQTIGWEESDAIGLNYEAVIKLRSDKEGELTPASHPLRQGLSSNQAVIRTDCEIITAANKKIPIALHVSPLAVSENDGVVMVFRDITDEILDNRQKAEFISTASHEMRTPVASIEGYLGLALNPQTATIDDKARTYLQKAHESAQHLGRLFQDLLDITRAEDGRLNSNPEIINLTDALRDYVELLTPNAQQKQLRLVFKPDHNPGAVNSVTPVYFAEVDRMHLREIMTNLIENAIKYTPEGEVSVDIEGDHNHVTISVKDSGIGIAKEDIPHIFEKFYRIDNTDTREIGGTGLGLYLCRRLAESMNGRLWAESRRGEGSEFFLELSRISSDKAARARTAGK